MRIGVLVTGDVAVRAAHSLTAHPDVDEVVVIGPARSKSFEVVESTDGCDFVIGSGPDAPRRAEEHGVPLLWDGETRTAGTHVWGASPQGLTLAMASRESDPRLVAVAHPSLEGGKDHRARFPEPVGRLDVADTTYAGKRLATARSPNEFGACLAIGTDRRVTIIDDGLFIAGIALAATIAVIEEAGPVWQSALPYLQAATRMGLVMAEDV